MTGGGATMGSVRVGITALTVAALAISSAFLLPDEDPAQSRRPLARCDDQIGSVRGPLPAEPIEVDLAPHQMHLYVVEAPEHAFLRVVAEQQGVDVALVLCDRQGRRLARADLPTDGYGPESISLISEGRAGLRIGVLAHQQAVRGRYRLTVEGPRPPTPEDRHRLAGERALSKARARAKDEEIGQVIPDFDLAARELAAAGDDFQRLFCLKEAGDLLLEAAEARAAAVYLEQALALAGTALRPVDRGRLYRALGRCLNDIGDLEGAQSAWEQGLRLLEEGSVEKWYLRYERNYLEMSAGDIREAQGEITELLKAAKQAKDVPRTLLAWLRQALIYVRLEAHGEAREILRPALQLARSTGDRRGEATALELEGRIFRREQRPTLALSRFELALATARRVKDAKRERMNALVGRGLALLDLHRFEEARAAFEQAQQWLGDRRAGSAGTPVLINLSWLAEHQGRCAEAEALARQALDQARRLRHLAHEGAAHFALANALACRQQWSEAREAVERATEIVEKQRARIGSSELELRYFSAKQHYYELYLDVLDRLGKESPREAAAYAAEALEVSERSHARGLTDALARNGAPLRSKLSTELRQRDLQVDQALGLARSALARVSSGAADLELQQRLASRLGALETERQRLDDQVRAADPGYADLTRPQPLGLAEIQALLVGEATQLLVFSAGQDSYYGWLIGPRELVWKRLEISREQLDRLVERALAGYSSGDQTGARGQLELDAVRLGEVLLGPFLDHLDAERLAIVPAGALHYVPFPALPIAPAGRSGPEGRPILLLDRAEVVLLPSISAWALMRSDGEPSEPSERWLAAVGDPVLEPEDPRLAAASQRAALSALRSGSPTDGTRRRLRRLPFAGEEIDAIADLVPAPQILKLVGFDATRDALTSGRLAGYRILHFATHGELDTAQPSHSKLYFSSFDANGNVRPSALGAFELYDLELTAELVVVSACRSALGEEIDGEGFLSFTRGFFHAGAPRVIVSLWDVHDAATAGLMKRFYQHLMIDRERPAAALRAAQNEMREHPTWSSPYYWAAFALHGDWR